MGGPELPPAAQPNPCPHGHARHPEQRQGGDYHGHAGHERGNLPENARGLDSYGFADLEYAMCFNCALSWVYPYGDPRRIFGQGTPKEVWHLMVETWTVVGAPSNARITEVISGWERLCDKIIEAGAPSFWTRISGPAGARGRCTERATERQSSANATARARTCLSSLCTPR